jgi:hypothetical protein
MVLTYLLRFSRIILVGPRWATRATFGQCVASDAAAEPRGNLSIGLVASRLGEGTGRLTIEVNLGSKSERE